MHMIMYSTVHTVVAPMMPIGISLEGFFACIKEQLSFALSSS